MRRSNYVEVAGFEVHVSEWGNPNNPPIVMWHGLARTGRDFDEIANAMSVNYFVICPDTIGRGLSEWAQDAKVDYTLEVYGKIATAIVAHYNFATLKWVGTSMGGLLGMALAADSLKNKITHLLINDVGPEVSAAGARRIAEYVGKPPTFPTMQAAQIWFEKTYKSFGDNTPEFWRRMADTSVRRNDDGYLSVHYDTRIVQLVADDSPDIDLWWLYELVTAKCMVMRGESSDVLATDVAQNMTTRGPKPNVITIKNCGHAPTLANEEQIAIVAAFLAL